MQKCLSDRSNKREKKIGDPAGHKREHGIYNTQNEKYHKANGDISFVGCDLEICFWWQKAVKYLRAVKRGDGYKIEYCQGNIHLNHNNDELNCRKAKVVNKFTRARHQRINRNFVYRLICKSVDNNKKKCYQNCPYTFFQYGSFN